MSSIAKFDVKKFDGSNDFGLWRVKMRCLLIQHGWEDALDPFLKIMRGAEKTAALKTNVYKKAHSVLLLCLDNKVLREVNKEDSAAEVWLKLETLYMTKSLANKLYLKKKLFTFYMHSGKKLSEHIDEFNKLTSDLANIDVDIDDKDQALMLLTSLPSSYVNFVETFLYGRELLTLEDVSSSLNSRELKKRTDAKDDGDGLYVRGRSDHRECPKWNKKKSTGFVKKNAGQGYDNGDLLMAVSEERLLEWIMNSGGSYHLTPRRDFLFDFKEFNGGTVLLDDNRACAIMGTGKERVQMKDGSSFVLENVRYIPELKRNLISLGTLDREGYTMKLQNWRVKVIKGSLMVLSGTIKENCVYSLDGWAESGEASVGTQEKESLAQVWHKRMGHISKAGLHELERREVLGKKGLGKLEFCKNCVLGKSTRVSFGQGQHKTGGVIDYVHADLWGPSRVESMSGCRKFKEWKQLVENQTGRKLKKLRTDNGLKFYNQKFNNLCKESRIARHLTVAGTPQQNGLAERMNRTLLNKVRFLVIQSGLPYSFWAEATVTAAYLINRSPSTALEKKTPMDLWSGHPANYEMLMIFGYRFWRLDDVKPKIIISRDVVFNESLIYKDTLKGVGAADSRKNEDEEHDEEPQQ
ncbi:retrovirus-related pol polyprotein from transposon TNT 1-94 [Tanacetum coccineum]